jgi:hypothetical protein
MKQAGYPQVQPQRTVQSDAGTSEWSRYVRASRLLGSRTDTSRIYKSGKCSDFTIFAGNRKFLVHRVLSVSTSHRCIMH